MLGPDVPVRKPLCLFRGIGQYTLAFIAQGKIHGSRNLFANRGVTFNLLANGLDRGVRAQESIGQGFVFAQKPQQQVLGLNIRGPELACFVARKENYAPGFLRVTFKHNALPPDTSGPRRLEACSILPKSWSVNVHGLNPVPAVHIMQSNGHQTQVLKRFYNVTEGTCSTPPRLPISPVSCTLSY